MVSDDIQFLKEILDSSELFPSEFLDEMIAGYFSDPNSEEIWFTHTINQMPVGLGFCAPEKFTNGSYNLYAIAVSKEKQGKGIGHKMMHFIEDLLAQNQKRILIVETSSQEKYKLTRDFYKKLNYQQAAIIKDFWDEGDDKIIFLKKINEILRK